MAPIWYTLLIIPIALVTLFIYGRAMKRVNDKVKRGEAKWTDDWDPFQ